MEKQDAIIKRYQQLLPKNKTFKLIAAHTGIQVTRVFRLFNGSKMRLEEYQIFESCIKEAEGSDNSLHALIDICLTHLSLETIEAIRNDIERKLRLKRFIISIKKPFNNPNTVA